jgi:chorismate mutase
MDILQPYRAIIDQLDDQIVALMVKRLAVVRDVAALKIKEGIPAVLEDRIREVIDRAGENAGPENEEMVREVYIMLVAVSCDLEEQLISGELSS